MSRFSRTYKKLLASLVRAEAYIEALESYGINMGTSGKHTRNARKAVEKAGRQEFPSPD